MISITTETGTEEYASKDEATKSKNGWQLRANGKCIRFPLCGCTKVREIRMVPMAFGMARCPGCGEVAGVTHGNWKEEKKKGGVSRPCY